MKKNAAKKRKLNIARVLFLLFFLGCIYIAIGLLPAFRIENIGTEGARLLIPDEIISAANIPVGQSLLLADFRACGKRIENIPAVKKVKIARLLPNRVMIRVEERKEAIICVLKNKQSLIIDRDGYVLNPQNYNDVRIELPDLTNLPVMNGLPEEWLENGRRINAEIGKNILKLLSQFEAFVVPQKLQIDVSNEEDIKLLVDDILIVKIGSADDLQKKMEAFQAVYAENKDRKTGIEYIDVSSIGFPAVKLKR